MSQSRFHPIFAYANASDARRTMVGPYVKVQSVDTLRRMLAYLGASPEQIGNDSVIHEVA